MTTVRRWLGIPYARSERFQLPQPVAFDPTRDTSRFGPGAPQPPGEGIVPGGPIDRTDEHECFSLNVWSREGAKDLPVMVWFPGGAFMTGATSQPVFDGARFAAEQDVVIVSANYRLGALGFLDTRPLGGDHANLGLHDALTALRWVREHIATFGGDPARVTIFGESAGGGVCMHLFASPAADRSLTRAIVQSGITNYTLDAERAAVVARAFCQAAGAADLRGLMAAPLPAILAAQAAVLPALLQPIGMMPFHPCIDGDLLTDAPHAALRGGIAAGRRLLAGTTRDEMRLYVDLSAPAPERERLCRRVARYVGVDPTDAHAIVQAYETDMGGADLNAAWAALFTDVEMHLPLRAVLEAQTKQQPTFAYLFDWQAPNLGAFHAVDIPFTFDTFDAEGWGEFIGADDAARRVGEELRTAWASFARDGDPGWAPYPATKVFARKSRVSPMHPLFGRAAAL